MWSVAKAKRDLDNFLGPKMIPNTWMRKLKFFKKGDNNVIQESAETIARGDDLTPVLKPTKSKT